VFGKGSAYMQYWLLDYNRSCPRRSRPRCSGPRSSCWCRSP